MASKRRNRRGPTSPDLDPTAWNPPDVQMLSLDALAETNVRCVQVALEVLASENRSLRKQIEDDRRDKRERDAARDKAMEHALGQALPLLPIVVDKFVNGDNRKTEQLYAPDLLTQAVIDVQVFKQFWRTVTKDEMDRLMETFGPRLIPTLDIIIRYMREDGAIPMPPSPPSGSDKSPEGENPKA